MSIRIHVVQSEREARAIYRLRYQVYIEELGRTQLHADHDQRRIKEPLDSSGHLFIALERQRAVGTLRINYARNGDLGFYPSVHQMHLVGKAHPAHTSLVTKLVVANGHRGSSLAYRLAMAVYQHALHAGILFDFIDVYPDRVPFFERLGYRVHVPSAIHPEFGTVVVMKLDMHDTEHFQRVGSPFLRCLKKPLQAA